MEADNDILKRIDRRDGMTVPEGYFADFAARMASSLETTPFEQSASPEFKPAPTSMWQRVRPYVYLAAMFAGVWCMLKMFTMLSGNPSEMTPGLAEALDNDRFVDRYIIDDIDSRDLFDQLMLEGVDFENMDFEEFPDEGSTPEGTESQDDSQI